MENVNEIMKASAGSGKTYSLALRYITLLLLDNGACPHRHILAVTFTNKATAEMKKRILDELHILSTAPASSQYLEKLKAELNADEATLGERAKRVLGEILSDYGSFAVSTIDRFFQQVLRAFSREIGQVAEYQVELDRQSLIDEAVDRVLEALSEEGNPLRAALTALALGKLHDSKKFDIEATVKDFAQAYFQEQFGEKVRKEQIDEEKVFSEENIRTLTEACRKSIEAFDNAYKAAAEAAKRVLEGYPEEDLKSKDQVTKFTDCAPDKFDRKSIKTWQKILNDGSCIFYAKAAKKYGLSDAAAISEACLRLEKLMTEDYPERKTAALLLEQAPLFRTAAALKASFAGVMRDRGVLSIDDTNQILHEIIGETSTPFIYEKVGVRYRHFLLDEFQDTSTVQWENFLPLLKNPTGERLYNLLVGDVKQSIYRWRSARWDILKSEVGNALQNIKENPLKVNWRSAEAIVTFNNAFFKHLASALDANYSAAVGRPNDGLIASLYADVEQEVGKTALNGSVEFSFGTDEDAEGLDKIAAAVRDAQQRGFALRDIAVLVRKNEYGSKVATRLLQEGIPVISNDSLKIISCPLVRRLAARLALLDNPSDTLSRYEAGEDFDAAAFHAGFSLGDLAQRLLALEDKEEVNAATPYLLAFLDRIRDYVACGGNSLHGFLQDWKQYGAKAAIASPEGGDAVTIITIHKAKGLDFPFVILPLPLPSKDPYIHTKNRSWEFPDIPEGSPLQGAAPSIYNVPTASLSDTFFRESYEQELQLSMIDSINTWYVAMTRATTAMHVIVPEIKEGKISGELYAFLAKSDKPVKLDDAHFLWGASEPVRKAADKQPAVQREELPLRFLDPSVDASAPRRLAIRQRAEDFFKREAGLGDARVRGIVLHHILENVRTSEDLAASVDAAYREGLLDEAEAQDTLHMLSKALDGISGRRWFSADSAQVLDERDLCDRDGSIHRPDRVIIRDGSVEIIDYKFGIQEKEHIAQVERYKRLYGELGFKDIRGFLWYVSQNSVISV